MINEINNSVINNINKMIDDTVLYHESIDVLYKLLTIVDLGAGDTNRILDITTFIE